MRFASWLLRRVWRRPPTLRSAACRPRLEGLEERTALAVLTNPGLGPVVPHVRLQAVYYNDLPGHPALPARQLDQFLASLAGGPYLDMLSQYQPNAGGATIGRGSALPGYHNGRTVAGTIRISGPQGSYNGPGVSDGDIQNMLRAAIDHGRLTPDGSTEFVVCLPAGVGVDAGDINSENSDGYHTSFTYQGTRAALDGLNVYYAVIVDPGSGGVNRDIHLTAFQHLTVVTSHEVAETVTDPTGTSWLDYSGSGGEVADLEAWNYSTLNGYAVQDLWSNQAHAAMRAAGTDLYVNRFYDPPVNCAGDVIATCTDADAGPGTSFQVVIDWGDGSVTYADRVVPVGGGRFNVVGSHRYHAPAGTRENLSLWVNETDRFRNDVAHAEGRYTFGGFGYDDLGLATLRQGTLNHAPAQPPITGTAGQGLSGVPLVLFTDTANTTSNFTGYTAQVTWTDPSGQPQTTAGTVSFDAARCTCAVLGSSGFVSTRVGTYHVSITVTAPDSRRLTVGNVVRITDAPVLARGGNIFTFTEHTSSGKQVLASFTDPGGSTAAGEFSAAIDWGDGARTAGTIVYDPATASFQVLGRHTYAAATPAGKPFPITVTIHHRTAPAQVVTDTAMVTDPPVHGIGTTFAVAAGVDSGRRKLATFTDPAGPEGLSHYAATVNWGGAGSATRPVTITSDPASGIFTVFAGYQYAVPGRYAITVTVRHDSAAYALFASTALVAGPLGTPVLILAAR
jgi:hypothetical protein